MGLKVCIMLILVTRVNFLEAAAQISGASLDSQPMQDCQSQGQRCMATPMPNLLAILVSEEYVHVIILSKGNLPVGLEP